MNLLHSTFEDILIRHFGEQHTQHDLPRSYLSYMDSYGDKNDLLSIVETIADKEHEYGSTYTRVARMLQVLYPRGCSSPQLDEFILISKILEKLARLSSQNLKNKADTYQDIVGYALLGTQKDNERNSPVEPTPPTLVINSPYSSVPVPKDILKG